MSREQRWLVHPIFKVLLLALLFSVSAAQSAPLLDGLGGPLGYGESIPPVGDSPVDATELWPDGVSFYDAEPYSLLFANRPGSISFGARICCRNSTWELPAPPLVPGEDIMLPPRIVAFRGFGQQDAFEAGGPETFRYQALVPPTAPEPGRFVATWYRVPDRYPDEIGQQVNSWQAIMTPVGDAGDFDLELRFAECGWLRQYRRPDVPLPLFGFDAGLGEDGPGWMWSGSLSRDTLLLCGLSNVREPGVFRYAFRDGWPSGCGYDAEPPPGEDRCADGNHLPGDGCSPACYVEPDIDGDGRFEAPHPDAVDPEGVYDDCTDLANPLCDDDPDRDGIPSINDNCPDDANPDQRDYDLDRRGDACDIDLDGDILVYPEIDDPREFTDLCPFIHSNGSRIIDPELPEFSQQSDIDRDGMGDQCDADDDGDGILDCGADGICATGDNGYDDDRDIRIDEAGECVAGDPEADRCNGATDMVDNDADGFIDEFSEAAFERVEWPGPEMPPLMPEDSCRRIPNAAQADLDGDGIGDACDPDLDGDGINNCAGDGICGPLLDGRDNDLDGRIDERLECAEGCDPARDLVDQDQDGYVDEALEAENIQPLPAPVDNCPRLANDQTDSNLDGIGDACADDDMDGYDGHVDNCPETANPEQDDLDGDGAGDACDADDDGDGVPDDDDNCPRMANPDQTNLDEDGMGDACDADRDGDGVNNIGDVCPYAYDPAQVDTDGDGRGDVCDADNDNDGISDGDDVCPLIADGQVDTDGDGDGDACDEDDDGDGVPDEQDGCPLIGDGDTPDLDGDGISDACDPQDDRPFAARSPEERCAILIAQGAPTAERLQHCPAPAASGCRAAPGDAPTPWPAAWLIGGVWVGLRRRPRRMTEPRATAARPAASPSSPDHPPRSIPRPPT